MSEHLYQEKFKLKTITFKVPTIEIEELSGEVQEGNLSDYIRDKVLSSEFNVFENDEFVEQLISDFSSYFEAVKAGTADADLALFFYSFARDLVLSNPDFEKRMVKNLDMVYKTKLNLPLTIRRNLYQTIFRNDASKKSFAGLLSNLIRDDYNKASEHLRNQVSNAML